MKKVDFLSCRYVSEKFNYILEKKAYIDKGPTGAGITTWCCSKANPDNTILVAPNISLVESLKQDNSGLVDQDALIVFNSEEDLSISRVLSEVVKVEKFGKKAWKLITTGDSLQKLESSGILDKAGRIVLDESDQFLLNTQITNLDRKDRNRSSLEVLEKYQDIVTFVSSTPIDSSVLPEWIQKLQQIQYVWNEEIVQPIFKISRPWHRLQVDFLVPLSKGRPVGLAINHKLTPVTKVIVYANDLKKILDSIKSTSFPKEHVRILCGKDSDNDKRLKEAGLKRLEDFHKLPRVTFVTRAGWRGVSLYDPDAISVVVSTVKPFKKDQIDFSEQLNSIVDLYSDLEQVLGRNRCNTNRFRLTPIVLCSTLTKDVTSQDIDDLVDRKVKQIQNLVDYEDCLEETWKQFRDLSPEDWGRFTYKNSEGRYILDKVAVEIFKADLKSKVVSCCRRIKEVTKIEDYTIFETCDIIYKTILESRDIPEEFKDTEEYELVQRAEKLGITHFPETIAQLRIMLGSKEKEMSRSGHFRDVVLTELKKLLNPDTRYSLAEIKDTLQKVYDGISGCKRKATGTQINEYADVSKQVATVDGKKVFLVKIKSWK